MKKLKVPEGKTESGAGLSSSRSKKKIFQEMLAQDKVEEQNEALVINDSSVDANNGSDRHRGEGWDSPQRNQIRFEAH